MKFPLLICLLSFHFEVFAGPANDIDVVYGVDNRIEPFESGDQKLKELARSTAAMINHRSLVKSETQLLISGPTLKNRQHLCEDERFVNQTAEGNCSGFLADPTHIITAGHCITSEASCSEFRWVFDNEISSLSQETVKVPATSVYSCRKVVAVVNDRSSLNDYAVIELDRPVLDRVPLPLRKSGSIRTGAEVAVIGHPDGLPKKIADGGTVRKKNSVYFTTNLDTFHVNSGSAVINLETYEVEGILVRGEDDYEFDSVRGCAVVKSCEEQGCRGEDVTVITNVPKL